jgi:hypothetical protein
METAWSSECWDGAEATTVTALAPVTWEYTMSLGPNHMDFPVYPVPFAPQLIGRLLDEGGEGIIIVITITAALIITIILLCPLSSSSSSSNFMLSSLSSSLLLSLLLSSSPQSSLPSSADAEAGISSAEVDNRNHNLIPNMSELDIRTFLTGIYASPVGCLQSYYDLRDGTIAPTISHPDVGYSPNSNFFDPDNYISVSAMMYSGDDYLMKEVRKVLERTAETM